MIQVLMRRHAPEHKRTEHCQHKQMNHIRRFDPCDTSQVILPQADGPVAAKILARKGQREDAPTDRKEELNAEMARFKAFSNQATGAVVGCGIKTEMKQADAAYVVSNYRHD